MSGGCTLTQSEVREGNLLKGVIRHATCMGRISWRGGGSHVILWAVRSFLLLFVESLLKDTHSTHTRLYHNAENTSSIQGVLSTPSATLRATWRVYVGEAYR